MDRLDLILERHLGPVSAPNGLWDVVQHPPTPRRRRQIPGSMVALAAVLPIVAVCLLPRHGNAPLSRQALAIEALSREPEDLELRSDTVTEIRTWVKSKTGLDIPLPAATSEGVRMTGVCALKGGALTVEVAYRVSGHNAALLVSKASVMSSGERTHRFLKCESVGGTRVSSWTMHGQLYTLAYAANSNAAAAGGKEECLLCHSGGEPHI